VPLGLREGIQIERGVQVQMSIQKKYREEISYEWVQIKEKDILIAYLQLDKL